MEVTLATLMDVHVAMTAAKVLVTGTHFEWVWTDVVEYAERQLQNIRDA